MLAVLIGGTIAAILVDAYWRFYWTPKLKHAAWQREQELANRCEELSGQLTASEERFEWFADKTTNCLYRMSVPDGRYTYVNQAAIDYHKYTREEFMAQPMLVLQALHPDYHEEFARDWENIINDRPHKTEREFRITDKEGKLRWLHQDVRTVYDKNRRPIAIEGLVIDITEEKRTQNALRDSEAHLRRAQEVAQLGIWRLDTGNDTLEWSAQTYDIFGAERGTKIRPDRYWNMVHPDDRDAVDAAWQRAQEGNVFDIEYRILTQPSNEIRWVHNRAELETGETGIGKVAVGVIQDITERKRLEAELLQAQKMEAIGTLAGGIAHDFNNILGVILGYSEILMAKIERKPEYAAAVGHILDATERARNLIRQIVTLSHKVEPKRAPVNVNKEIVHILEVWKQILPRAIHIETHLADDVKFVSADANQLNQVFMNLATNAVDAMRGGGRLSLATSNVTLRNHACTRCGALLNGNMVCITVSDTGCGIPPENMGKIFNSFFTTKEPGHGTGLGLSSVLGIIERHGGHIECHSVVDSGTDFRIYLPAVSAPVFIEPLFTSGPDYPLTGNETILLVDDEEDLLDINNSFLMAAGYNVITASSGKEALTLYEQGQPTVDLIISDLNMPGMSVDKYVRGLLAINPDAKIIALSGYLSAIEASSSLPEGVAVYLGKPCRRMALLRAARDVLDERISSSVFV